MSNMHSSVKRCSMCICLATYVQCVYFVIRFHLYPDCFNCIIILYTRHRYMRDQSFIFFLATQFGRSALCSTENWIRSCRWTEWKCKSCSDSNRCCIAVKGVLVWVVVSDNQKHEAWEFEFRQCGVRLCEHRGHHCTQFDDSYARLLLELYNRLYTRRCVLWLNCTVSSYCYGANDVLGLKFTLL